ncbi:MAG: hypothetical protein IT343_14760 [Candidatus Melainabacteria bacterium]|jgi:hypothetical protein|nr:hypothetical protein [Candidatus Melainabacteria bacterium]
MSPTSEQEKQSEALLATLIEKNIITTAQAEVVRYDCSSMGVPSWESLTVRGWVAQEVLVEEAPWLGKSLNEEQVKATDRSVYEQNLRRYESLMREIMDDK